jgi:hypothetical protein
MLAVAVDGAICDPGYWQMTSGDIDAVVAELNEWYAVAKVYTGPVYEAWYSWTRRWKAASEREQDVETEGDDKCKGKGEWARMCVQTLYGETPVRQVLPANTRVMLADYALLRRDFADALGGKSDQEIDEWVLENLVYVSEVGAWRQSEQPPSAGGDDDEKKNASPRRTIDSSRFGLQSEALHGVRQLVSHSFVLADESGAPLADVVEGWYDTVGNFTLAEAMRDFVVEKMTEAVLHHSDVRRFTVGSYAAIDLGFELDYPSAESLFGEPAAARAGLLLRQPTTHRPSLQSVPSPDDTNAIERALRRYGVSSADGWFGICEWSRSVLLTNLFPDAHLTNAEVELVHLPMTLRGDVLDVSTVKAHEEFDRLVASWLAPNQVMLAAQDQQAVPKLQIDIDEWGHDCRDTQIVEPSHVAWQRATRDRPLLTFGELADLYAHGDVSVDEIRSYAQGVIDDILVHLDLAYNYRDEIHSQCLSQRKQALEKKMAAAASNEKEDDVVDDDAVETIELGQQGDATIQS